MVDRLCITIAAINTTKDLVPIALAKGILGTVASILTIAQVGRHKPHNSSRIRVEVFAVYHQEQV